MIVTLKDNNQNPMKNCNINIKINGITYTKTTNDHGKVFQNINLLLAHLNFGPLENY